MLESVIEAGADAVYLGGKQFNMRLHRQDANFDDETLAKAVDYAHIHGVKAYVTVNNLLCDDELLGIKAFIKYLDSIRTDAILIQDLALLKIVHDLGVNLPLHASVMMNIHNKWAVRQLQDYGVTRIVAARELTLAQLALIKQHTGIETEYFIHGDMCVAVSGQCHYSGIIFGQSSNRGRCLKPCRWPFELTSNHRTKDQSSGPFKLAVKDMCLFRHIPELIHHGVDSFKIEGRMRTADFVSRIVGAYRKAIDLYLADPGGYSPPADEWQTLYDNRVRNFSTCYAFGNPGSSAIGYSGRREPRSFSQAVKEATLATRAGIPQDNKLLSNMLLPTLSVRVADFAALQTAFASGADIVYIGGDAYKPYKPWPLAAIVKAADFANSVGKRLVVAAPRLTLDRECADFSRLLEDLTEINPAGIMVGNIGSLLQARQYQLPIYTDLSFNILNSVSIAWLKEQGVSQITASPEATFREISAMSVNHQNILEVIVHGSLTAMVTVHCLPKALTTVNLEEDSCPHACLAPLQLVDSAGEQHSVKTDQFCRSHIFLANDLCLLPFLAAFAAAGVNNYRIEGQHYDPQQLSTITAIYRGELDRIAAGSTTLIDSAKLTTLADCSPRQLGIGVFRYQRTR
jgi:putative protease